MKNKSESLDKYLVSTEATIVDAMKVMTLGGKKIALVVDGEMHLKGVITDGDIRRGLLTGVQMSAPVSTIMNKHPITANQETSRPHLLEILRSKSIQQIPLVSPNGVVSSVVSIEDLIDSEEEKDNAVVLMVGGLGSRLGELTANCPKPLLKVGDKPILELILDNFKHHGFKNFFLSVNYRSEMIESHFGDGSKFGVNIQYIREKQRMGTAGSLSLFKPTNQSPIFVMNGDLLTQVNLSSLLRHHQENEFEISTCVRQYDYQIPFGVVKVEKDGFRISNIEEKPLKSYLVNAGIYVLNPSVLELIPHNSYFDMPSLLEKAISSSLQVGAFPIHEYWRDIGQKDDFLQAEKDYKRRIE